MLIQKIKFLCLVIILFILSHSAIGGNTGVYKADLDQDIAADRWIEIDLYWFDYDDMEASAEQFWDRYYPMFENIENWKGVILNVGWLMDTVYEWQGSLNKKIALPKDMEHWPFIKDEGQLTGNTEQRKELWKHRFETLDGYNVVNYAPWTYGDLKKLVTILKKVGRDKYGLEDIRIGMLALGWRSIYHGELSAFSKTHENAYLKRGIKWGVPNLIAKLKEDPREYGAYPDGIPEGTPLVEFFGKQWGDLSKTVGLDAIVLRDSIMGVGIYVRNGPYGRTPPEEPKKVSQWSQATADLVRHTKQSNPEALVIGYSSAASAVGDWRVNCFDLETIAKEGYLDAWIDQSWAGAWNEVGQRPPEWASLWNAQRLGWTYQLGYILGHAAVLAESDVRHYFLTETFDAWESWDIIHTAADRLRWGIWAYSHAAVKTPSGLKMPAGSYISWCNQGKRLLSEEDVDFIVKHTNAALIDARNTKEVYGPTLVYNRSAMEWQNENSPNIKIKEWIDEQAGAVMKWSVPIMSITRLEYLKDVESDMFIVQTPVHMEDTEKENLIELIKSGKPTAIFGSPAGGLDKDVAEIIGIKTNYNTTGKLEFIATLNGQVKGIFEGLPNTFPLYHYFTKNKLTKPIQTLYWVKQENPALVLNNLKGKSLLFWDPPEFATNIPYGNAGSLDQDLGSPIPYCLTARAINKMSKEADLCYVDQIKPYRPMQLSCWKTKDGHYRILAGNLEEGINHKSDKWVHNTLNIPESFELPDVFTAQEFWQDSKYVIGDNKLRVVLDQAETKLYILENE
ncbi:hypothetical protein [Sedimentisphaera salicampi]|uniref:Beta-galactosidase trimerization domain protein n=1 Tax=Sedimentisphaera salicampi TaxID=1941349 RepID=A0A1W6LQ55_9BACT|nr:hypothetical protein [Sedimentisphaera salicampi]ARN57853.1 hypothetical protein STSP1_02279 [Sedimentisphaera salicampi]